MFTLLPVISWPALSGTVAGSFEWPAIGAVFAWFVLAVLLTGIVELIAEHPAHAPERESKGAAAYNPPLRLGHARHEAA